jgi:hypothetical protein
LLVLVVVLVAGAGCWGWLLGLVAGAGCWCWLLGLVAGAGCWGWLVVVVFLFLSSSSHRTTHIQASEKPTPKRPAPKPPALRNAALKRKTAPLFKPATKLEVTDIFCIINVMT